MPTPRDIARSALIWAGIAGVTIAALPPMVIGYPLVVVDPNRALSDWWFRRIGRALAAVNPAFRVSVEGREKLTRGGPFVLVANHQSFADLIAMCFLEHPTKYLGKEAVFKVPVLGWALRIAGEVPVRRGDKASGHEALDALGEWLYRGVSVTLFPEGTRTESGALGAFKPGAFALAVAHGRPVVPVVISGARDLLPKGSVVFEQRAHVRLRVLDPIPTVDLAKDDVIALSARVREAMARALDELEGAAER